MKTRWLELVVVFSVVAAAVVLLRDGDEPSQQLPPEKPPVAATPASHATPAASATPPAQVQLDGPLTPLSGKTDAPTINKVVKVLMTTDAGEIVLELYPEAAPNAVERFLELVDLKFYDNTSVSRVVSGFVAQFGINPRQREWKDKHFKDDPSYFQLLPGTIAFAKAGPDTNSTQVFINLQENNRLAGPGLNFTVFGKVTSGMDVVGKFAQVGHPSHGLDQTRLWAEPNYLDTLSMKPTMIITMELVK